MFTNTFKLHVQNQLNTRSAINMDIKNPTIVKDSENYIVNNPINWLNRTPFVFAYSNLRYDKNGDPNIEENMKWSVLSSFKVTGSSQGFTYEKYILQDKLGFYDYYENDLNFGIIPKPHITTLDIRGRGTNGTLKDINMEIVCYSFQQFANIRKYFSVPCTSIFLQFGYFVNVQDLSAILPPVFCGYHQLTKTDPKAQNSYINTAKYYKYLDDKKIVNIDGVIAIVYGFDVNQQQGNIFKLRVNMMCKGNSEILNYVKPDLKLAFNNIPRVSVKKQGSTTGGQNNSDKKSTENNLTNYIRSLSQKTLRGKHSIVLNSNGQRYVTFDWINYAIIYLLRRTTVNAFVDKDSNRIPVDDIYKPLYYFEIQKDFNADFYSNTIDVAIIPKNNKIGYSFVYENGSTAEESLNAKIEDLIQLYQDLINIIEKNDKQKAYIAQNDFKKQIKDYYTNKYLNGNSSFKNGGNAFFGYLGHVYFRLQAILQLLKDQQKITLDSFMTSLSDMITSATNRGLVCSTSFDHRTEKFKISQHSLSFLTANDIYYIPNFGAGSIVKQITYNLKMPDGYKVTIFQAYGANNGIMNNLFDNMFNGGHPQDIYLYKGIPDQDKVKIGEDVTVDYEKQLKENVNIVKSTFNKTGKINCVELSKDSVKKAVDLYNEALYMTSKQNIAKETGHKSISSIYAIQVQVILDFIAGIDWGQVFKLAYNPLGWETKFYVSDIQHRIGQGNAQTILKGIMFG